MPFARRLIATFVQRLEPGGTLVVANFLPECDGRGYMETMMDWHLVYRSETELMSLFNHALSARLRTFVDPHRNVAYAEYRHAN
jgi:extracellular factor (EF) 3-hydroxypalmitic acid methyl ester biosynthesis protein